VTVVRVEVALVSDTSAIVDFITEVFEVQSEPPMDTAVGVLYRIELRGVTLKVMVPPELQSRGPVQSPYEGTGLRYLTLYVDALEPTVERALVRGAELIAGPLDTHPGVRLALMRDPFGNYMEVVHSTIG
jgi:predicted enzyme related to lactoylglutathione lyase